MPRRVVTMRDVAQRAGVAVSTVSRVMSQPERISAPTRETVLLAVRELGYRAGPSQVEPAAPPGSVALLVPDVGHPFYLDIIRGCQSRLKAAGFLQVLVDTEESADVEAASLALLDGACAGVVLAAPRMSDDAVQEAARRLPLVAINRRVPGVRSVVMDSGPAAGQAVDHLASLGHRRICFVAGPDSSWASRERWQGCRDAGRRLGLDVVRVGPYVPTSASAPAAADALLHTGATAAVAFNDLLAIGMLRRLADRGVDVPGEVSLVGCDDIFGADFCHPALTTLSSPRLEAGRLATTLLLEQIGVQDLSARGTTALPVHLTIRSSTGPAPAGRAGARRGAGTGQDPAAGPEESRTTT
jgi:LacI family repressor for deo operon, udp, cdd, tsx, nupC, and nupG